MIEKTSNEARHITDSDGVYCASTLANNENLKEAMAPLVSLEEFRLEAGASLEQHDDEKAEIIYYVIDGQLTHDNQAEQDEEDDDDKPIAGPRTFTEAGEVQVTSTGTGLKHKELNTSDSTVHFIKAVIAPYFDKYTPTVRQKSFSAEDLTATGGEDPTFGTGKPFGVVTSTYAEYTSLIARQRGRSFLAHIKQGDSTEFEPKYGYQYWLQVIAGDATVNGEALATGDGARIDEEEKVAITCKGDAHLLLLEIPVGD